MYTLKIKWYRYEVDEVYAKDHPDANPQMLLADESTLFISADQVVVHGEIATLDKMQAWESGTYLNYSVPFSNGEVPEQQLMPGTRLIQVVRNDKDTWYLASFAWLLGPDGKTIEKLTV